MPDHLILDIPGTHCNGPAFCQKCRDELRRDPKHAHEWSDWYEVRFEATSLAPLSIKPLKKSRLYRHCERCLKEETQESTKE